VRSRAIVIPDLGGAATSKSVTSNSHYADIVDSVIIFR
jgi:hypothetical protein